MTRSRNSCQVAGWSKQDHRNSPPHFLPIGATLLSGLSSVTTLGCAVGCHPAVCSFRTIASVLYGCLAQCRLDFTAKGDAPVPSYAQGLFVPGEIWHLAKGWLTPTRLKAQMLQNQKMGNRQQQTNPADVAAFPKIKFSLHPKAQMGESDSLSDASGLTISDNQSTKLGINSSELQCVPVAFPVIIGSFLRPSQTCKCTREYLLPLAKCLHVS